MLRVAFLLPGVLFFQERNENFLFRALFLFFSASWVAVKCFQFKGIDYKDDRHAVPCLLSGREGQF